MRTHLDAWALAIGSETDENGAPTPDSVGRTLRAAVVEVGFATLARLKAGLRESYRPLGFSDADLSDAAEEALRTLVATGDLDLFHTASGRAFASTPARVVDWGGPHVAILGGTSARLGDAGVRRFARGGAEPPVAAAEVSLADELGRPEWLRALVSLGGHDPGDGRVEALAELVIGLARGGERYAHEPSNPTAVLSGRGDFFGDPGNAPQGRWERPGKHGTFPAVLPRAYGSRRFVVHSDDDGSRAWEPSEPDLWRWVVVAMTKSTGDDVVRYDPSSGRMSFLTPPPRQLERAARLAGTRAGPWSWFVDAGAFAVIEGLISRPSTSSG